MILVPKLRFRRVRLASTSASGAGTSDKRFSSNRILISALSLAVIGFSNFWQFPALLEQHGGSAFLLVYVFALVVVGAPLAAAQLWLGHLAQASPVVAFARLALRAKADSNWFLVGGIALFAGFLVYSYLSVIAGWTVAYAFRAVTGALKGHTVDGLSSIFSALVKDPEKQLFWHWLFVGATAVVLAQGLRRGLEKAVAVGTPALAALLLLLFIYSSTSDRLPFAIEQLLYPDFSELTAQSIWFAFAHAFFSLSLGVAVWMTFGAYAKEGFSPMRVSLWVAGIDTVVGLVAAVLVYTLLAAGNVETAPGLVLVFQSLPLALDHLVFGQFFCTVFFLLLVGVGFFSALALLEPVVAWAADRFSITRPKAAMYVGFAGWLTGLVMMFSFHPWAFTFKFFESTKKLGFFDVAQIFTSNVLLPLTGLLVSLFVGWVLKPEPTREALGFRSLCWFDTWRWLLRVIIPLLLACVAFQLPDLFA